MLAVAQRVSTDDCSAEEMGGIIIHRLRVRWPLLHDADDLERVSGGAAAGDDEPVRVAEASRLGDLHAHRPPLDLARCSGAHVLEFLRYLDRFGKTKVHAPPCPAFGGQQPEPAAAACRCPLRQAWGSLDALVGRLRAAYDARNGTAALSGVGVGGGGENNSKNPFAARAMRLYLRDAQSVARGISYNRNNNNNNNKKNRTNKHGGTTTTTTTSSSRVVVTGASSSSFKDDAGAVQQCARVHVNNDDADHAASLMATSPAPELRPPYPPPPYYLDGVPLECCGDFSSSVLGGGGAGGPADGCYATLYQLPLLFNTFGG
ncbi:hypothetical protein QOZ80_7BG0586230 [Eleusine coracana subsp. coracana]|nr:hypothetical protein QOZ80_7BG0586230 [Eleusine coracana subsp. coracana]